MIYVVTAYRFGNRESHSYEACRYFIVFTYEGKYGGAGVSSCYTLANMDREFGIKQIEHYIRRILDHKAVVITFFHRVIE